MYIELKTPRLLLRPLALTDLETTHAYAGDPEVGRYMLFLPNEALEDTEAFLRGVQAQWETSAPQCYEFAILLNGEHIGAVSLYLEEDWGELGWVLRRDCHGYGYATEAAEAVKHFAFDTLGLEKLVAHCDSRNLPSARVMKKLGMTLCSIGQRVYRDGETAEEWMYVLKKSTDF